LLERYYMTQTQLQQLKKWFDDYTAESYGSDEYVNANLKLKEDHSRRTAENILKISEELGLNTNQQRIAEALGLLHDIGRFKQFTTYRTYNDMKSENHSMLSLKVLREENILRDIERQEQGILEEAIGLHGARELPKNLNGEHRLFAKLIRDADKTDILYVVTTNYKRYKADPQGFIIEVEFPDEPGYSQSVIEDIWHRRSVDYKSLRTLNDMKLMFLGLVFDVNYPFTLKRISEAGYLEDICRELPDTQEIARVRKVIFDYVGEKI